jgi:dual specificity protein kinase YAK1
MHHFLSSMSDPVIESLTLFVTATYHAIMPAQFSLPVYRVGHALNAPEDPDPDDVLAVPPSEGHRIVHVNDVFRDLDGGEFRIIDVLGSGTYAYVFKCVSVAHPDRFYAIKVIKSLRNYKETGLNEILIHRSLAAAPNHPGKTHVMMPVTSFEIDGHVCLVMPLFARTLFDGIGHATDLVSHLERVRMIMEQLLQALDFVHRLGIFHCDIKTDNLLFTSDDADHVCLIDFGSAIMGDAAPGVYIQSRFYRSPEIIFGLPYDSRIDVWSAGCIAAELFLDFAVFGCETEFDVVHSMVGLLGPIPDRLLQMTARWQRFFDLGPDGFSPKSDTAAVLLTSHCYCQFFQERGVQTLENLILTYMMPEDPAEDAMLRSFADFVKALLEFDPNLRVTAARARTHPFIRQQPLPQNWAGLKEPRKEGVQVPAARKGAKSQDLIPPDILSLF